MKARDTLDTASALYSIAGVPSVSPKNEVTGIAGYISCVSFQVIRQVSSGSS